mgnify:CR=1 FL=1|jgi:hypothetical protein
MHPDKTLLNDFAVFILGSAMVVALLYIMSSSSTGYPPADQCAQAIRTKLSPYQAQQLTGSDQIPPRYETSRQWCEAHLDSYATQVNRAMSYPMYPTHDFGPF